MRQLELTERILRLRAVPTLRQLPAQDLVQLASSMRSRRFQRGDVMLREDEPPRSFFIVLMGKVTMRRRGKRIGTIRAPGAVGFMNMLARHAGGTSAVAETHVEAYEVFGDAMADVFEDHFSVLLGTLRMVADRLMQENQRQTPPPFAPPDVPFDHLVGDREIGIVERMFLLRRMRAFTHANLNSLATIARRMTEVREPAGTVLWRPGERADYSYFVVKGMLSLRWNDGETVQEVGPGYALGGAESLTGLPRWNELRTEEPVVLLRGSREAMIDLFEDDRELAARFMSMLATMVVMRWDRKAEEGVTSVGSGSPDSEPPPGVVDTSSSPSLLPSGAPRS
ncbi:MAG: cyclic nucleotide-binding domain-containing protein [Deltaproteobacteria bacterium]|nr:cyclic nucleotide-binding domain-containing protein [Deltaproteobacteria bacterium]